MYRVHQEEMFGSRRSRALIVRHGAGLVSARWPSVPYRTLRARTRSGFLTKAVLVCSRRCAGRIASCSGFGTIAAVGQSAAPGKLWCICNALERRAFRVIKIDVRVAKQLGQIVAWLRREEDRATHRRLYEPSIVRQLPNSHPN
jgi:hypothetical protein